MYKNSLSFLVQKLYFPLGLVLAFALFSVVLLHNVQERQQALALELQEMEHLAALLHEASLTASQDQPQQFSALTLQFVNSLAKAESSYQSKTIAGRLSSEYEFLKQAWESFQLQLINDQNLAEKSTVSARKMGASLEELEISCLRIKQELQQGLELASIIYKLSFWASLVFLLAAATYFIIFIHRFVLAPLHALEKEIARGDDSLVTVEAGSAAGIVASLQHKINSQRQQRVYLASAADEIGDGHFLQDEQKLQEAGLLGAALLRLRQKMQAFFQADQRRSWSSQGIEQFTRLLREEGHDTQKLCRQLISQLVPFMGANQGAIFTIAEEQGGGQVLELSAAYAWGRHKHLCKTIAWGEGLVGQVAQEQDMLLITDVPDEFITIGSGLGKAKPKCILLMPLLSNGSFQGVLELASFRMLEEHEIDFLKKLNESFAVTLSNLKINNQTKELLQKANAANTHLQSQEEELRQNAEELMATQEAMRKKENELSALFSSIDYSLFTAEFNMEAVLLVANDKFCAYLNLTPQALGQKSFFDLMQVPGWTENHKREFLQKLQSGLSQNLECRQKRDHQLWISASFTPVLNEAGRVQKVMMLGSDISEKKQSELAYIAQAEEITRQEERLRHYTAELEELQAGLSDRLRQAQQEMELQFREIALEKEKNEAILEGCVDGVVSFNESGEIEFFNHAAEEIWEISRADALGSHIQKLISIKIELVNGKPQVFFSKNGSLKMLDVRTEVPLIGAGGEEIEALLTLTKIKLGNNYMFTAFVQKVAVELF